MRRKELNLLIGITMLFSLFSCHSRNTTVSHLFEETPNPDLLILNGTVVDGSGAEGFYADLVIHEGKIKYVGNLGSAKMNLNAKEKIDATGKLVTPGFIDTHAHGNPLTTPEFHNFLAMGATTITLGQDGSSPENPAEWMQKVDQLVPGPNVVLFAGHGSLRMQSGIEYDSFPDEQQLEELEKLLTEALEAGCFGLSTGLEYNPGYFAGKEELVRIAKVTNNYNGLIMSHIRNEDDEAIAQSLNEFFLQGAYCPIQVSHIKVVYGQGASRGQEVLDLILQARKEGIDVTADVYPYLASYTGIGILFPEWAKPPFNYEQVKQEKYEQLAAYLRERVAKRNGPEATLIGTGKYQGMNLAEVAAKANKPFEEVLIREIGPDGARGAYFIMNQELQDQFITDSLVMICSDGSPAGHHPRGYGTFAKIIEDYVVKNPAMTTEFAIFKMTGFPARRLGLEDRGLIRKDYAADLLVFDPDEVKDLATYEKPHQMAAGFNDIVVNGKLVRKDGKFVGTRNGKMLRKKYSDD